MTCKGLLRRVLALWALLPGACSDPGGDVELDIVPPSHAEVGIELGVPLHAYAAGKPIEWSWQSLTNDRLAQRKQRPTLTAYSGGTAVWRWNPIAEDLGPQEIQFTATAGGAARTEVLSFTVDEGGTAPVFREPIGEGTTLDLRASACAKIQITIESSVSTQADLGLLDPPENVELAQTGELSGELSFCPSKQQIMDETVYPMTLTAAAGQLFVSKVYVIVLRRVT